MGDRALLITQGQTVNFHFLPTDRKWAIAACAGSIAPSYANKGAGILLYWTLIQNRLHFITFKKA